VSEARLIATALGRGVGAQGAAAELVRRLIALHGACNRIERSPGAAALWRAVPAVPAAPAAPPRPPADGAARKGKGPPRGAPPLRRRRRPDPWRGLYSRNVKE
jgi:hypothetical protein